MEQLVDTVATVSKTQSQNESITTVIIPKIIQQIPCSLQFNDWFPPLKYTLISPFDKIIENPLCRSVFFPSSRVRDYQDERWACAQKPRHPTDLISLEHQLGLVAMFQRVAIGGV